MVMPREVSQFFPKWWISFGDRHPVRPPSPGVKSDSSEAEIKLEPEISAKSPGDDDIPFKMEPDDSGDNSGDELHAREEEVPGARKV